MDFVILIHFQVTLATFINGQTVFPIPPLCSAMGGIRLTGTELKFSEVVFEDKP